jgi:16S rRNA (cytidine1402-2'-O)-methyltransferase
MKRGIISMARNGSQPNGRGRESQAATSGPRGTLYVVGTPIGHPDDITLRALAVLRQAAIVASEDPRATQTLLAHHGIATTITSYGSANRHEKMLILLDRLMQGEDIALVSDHGTPVIYDPGCLFVAAAHRAGIPVKAVPGPSTLTAATAISGFPGDAIIFDGHLPSTNHRLTQHLVALCKERRTLVFYVEQKTLGRLLKTLAQVLPTRQMIIATDLTTDKERLSRGRADELLDQIGSVPKESAVTVVIEGHRVRSQHYSSSSSRRRISTR